MNQIRKIPVIVIFFYLLKGSWRLNLQTPHPRRGLTIYLIVVWMVLNVALFALMLPGDPNDINNYIEPILWVFSIVGLLSMRKAGAALTVSVMCITLSTSMGIILLAYYAGAIGEAVTYVNALRIVINSAIIVYLFKAIFAGKFK